MNPRPYIPIAMPLLERPLAPQRHNSVTSEERDLARADVHLMRAVISDLTEVDVFRRLKPGVQSPRDAKTRFFANLGVGILHQCEKHRQGAICRTWPRLSSCSFAKKITAAMDEIRACDDKRTKAARVWREFSRRKAALRPPSSDLPSSLLPITPHP